MARGVAGGWRSESGRAEVDRSWESELARASACLLGGELLNVGGERSGLMTVDDGGCPSGCGTLQGANAGPGEAPPTTARAPTCDSPWRHQEKVQRKVSRPTPTQRRLYTHCLFVSSSLARVPLLFALLSISLGFVETVTWRLPGLNRPAVDGCAGP